MKFIILILSISITFSLFGECKNLINSKKAPKWTKLKTKIEKNNQDYYFYFIGSSKYLEDKKITEKNAITDASYRRVDRIWFFMNILFLYPGNENIVDRFGEMQKSIAKNQEILKCWQNPKNKEVYILMKANINNIFKELNIKSKISDDIVKYFNIIKNKEFDTPKYPKLTSLKATNKPQWIDRKIFKDKDFLYIVSHSKIYDYAYLFSKTEAEENVNNILNNFRKSKVKITISRENKDETSSIEVSFSYISMKKKVIKQWIDVKNNLIYILTQVNIKDFNKKNNMIINENSINMIKNNNKIIKFSPKKPSWINDRVKIIKIDKKDYYHIVGYSPYLGNFSMQFGEAKDNALNNLVFYYNKLDKQIRDKNGKLLDNYKISSSLYVTNPMIIAKWYDEKTKNLYVQLEIDKSLVAQTK